MQTEKEYRRTQLEKRAHLRRARGETAPEQGYAAPLPPNLTARQKLAIANANFEKRSDGYKEEPLTEAERGGLSLSAFNKLPPLRRLEIYNIAMLKRREQLEQSR